MDLEEARQPVFRDIFKELCFLHLKSQGSWVSLYYRFKHVDSSIEPFTRQWEYPWAIINSKIEKGHKVLDAGCGSAPLLLYLYKTGYLCFGLDSKFYDEVIPACQHRIKVRIALRLSKFYPLHFLFNPHKLVGMTNTAKALGFKINYLKGNLVNLPHLDNAFDRIFCISVAEHLSREEMLKAAGELGRVLKPGGLLIVTMDYAGTGLLWQDFIRSSGLSLFGESDFTPPLKGKYEWDVIGFVLTKR